MSIMTIPVEELAKAAIYYYIAATVCLSFPRKLICVGFCAVPIVDFCPVHTDSHRI